MKSLALIILAIVCLLCWAVIVTSRIRPDSQVTTTPAHHTAIADTPVEATATLDDINDLTTSSVATDSNATPDQAATRVPRELGPNSQKLQALQQELEHFRTATGYVKYAAANSVLQTAIVAILDSQGRWEKALSAAEAHDEYKLTKQFGPVPGKYTCQLNGRRYVYYAREFPERAEVLAALTGALGHSGEIPVMPPDLVTRIEKRVAEAIAFLAIPNPRK